VYDGLLYFGLPLNPVKMSEDPRLVRGRKTIRAMIGVWCETNTETKIRSVASRARE
jgi:hypothetical protein